jgi:hypothetical protein
MAKRETTLATLAAASETERVVLMLVAKTDGSVVELRQQSWGEGVGWYTQHSVELEPRQLAELKQTLGQAQRPAGDSTRKRTPNGFFPRVIHADSA